MSVALHGGEVRTTPASGSQARCVCNWRSRSYQAIRGWCPGGLEYDVARAEFELTQHIIEENNETSLRRVD